MRYIKEVLMYKFLKNASYILVLLGALNWGLVGLFGFDLFAYLFGIMTPVTRILYALVGLSALVSAVTMYSEHVVFAHCLAYPFESDRSFNHIHVIFLGNDIQHLACTNGFYEFSGHFFVFDKMSQKQRDNLVWADIFGFFVYHSESVAVAVVAEADCVGSL